MIINVWVKKNLQAVCGNWFFFLLIFKESSHLTVFLGIWNKMIFNRNKRYWNEICTNMFLKSQHIWLSVTEITRDKALIPPGRRTGCPSVRFLADPAWVRLWGEGRVGVITHQKSHLRGLSKQCISLVLPFQTYSWLVDRVYLKEICCNPKTLSVFWYELVEEGGSWLCFSELTWARKNLH